MKEPFCEKASPKKFILDATAGYRMMWFNKKHPNCIYLDQRPECEPDIVGDFRDLKQFPDESFRLIVFDPPHLFKKEKGFLTNIQAAYGYLQPDTWKTDLKKAFKEIWRILKPYGILIFKWNNHHISSNEVIDLAPAKPLVYQISQSRKRPHAKSGDRINQTLWFCFMKIPEESEGAKQQW